MLYVIVDSLLQLLCLGAGTLFCSVVLVPFLVCNPLAYEEIANCFNSLWFCLLSLGCQCSVCLSRDDVGSSVVCGFGISGPKVIKLSYA